MFISMFPMLRFRHHYNGEKQYALFVNKNTQENAVIIALDDAPFIEYYGQRKIIAPPTTDEIKMIEFTGQIFNYLSDNTPVYLIWSALGYDRDRVLKGYLSRNFRITIVGEKLSEDYHSPDLGLKTYKQKLYRLNLRM